MELRCSDKWLPERKYVLDILLRERLGLDYCLILVEDTQVLTLVLDDHRKIILHNPCFEDKTTLQWSTEDLPQEVCLWQSPFLSQALPVFYGEASMTTHPDNIEIHADLIGMTFFALSRWEELLPWEKDQWNRIKEKQLFFVKHKLDGLPVVDYIEELLRVLFTAHGIHCPQRRQYSVLATHDMDYHLCFPRWWSPIKNTLGDLLRRRNLKEATWSLKAGLRVLSGKKDPYDRIDYFMAFAKKYNLTSRYYWIPRLQKIEGASYHLDAPLIAYWIEKLESMEVQHGIHPSIGTYKSAQKMKEEMTAYSDVFGAFPMHARQHFLQFDIGETVAILDAYAPLVDSSLHFRESGGFRCGTSVEYPLYDFKNRCATTVREQPLIFMDQNLHNSPLAEKEVISHLQSIIQHIRQTNGTFTFLWHNSSFGHPRWEESSLDYPSLLQMCSDDEGQYFEQVMENPGST